MTSIAEMNARSFGGSLAGQGAADAPGAAGAVGGVGGVGVGGGPAMAGGGGRGGRGGGMYPLVGGRAGTGSGRGVGAGVGAGVGVMSGTGNSGKVTFMPGQGSGPARQRAVAVRSEEVVRRGPDTRSLEQFLAEENASDLLKISSRKSGRL
jgi:hypothetical protein